MKRHTFLLLFIFHFSFIIPCTSQIITTIAGNGVAGYSGDGGPATSAELYYVYGVAVDNSGNVYIADGFGVIRKVNTSGIINTIVGNGVDGYSGDGGPATAAEIDPYGIAIDKVGNIYIAEDGNSRVRKVNTLGIINTIAGNGVQGYTGDGGLATLAEINTPFGVRVDKTGNVFIADIAAEVVRMVDTLGIMHTFAGDGYHTGIMNQYGGYSGDGGPATAAELDWPRDVDFDKTGNVYIANEDSWCIRKVDSSGIISTFAGVDYPGYYGDGGPATSAELRSPTGVTANDSGVYIVDDDNARVRKVNSSGIITTFAGNGVGGFYGDGGPATNAELYPTMIATDKFGSIYISDGGNNRIWKVSVVLRVVTDFVTNVNCNGGSNGSVTAIANEGLPPYAYLWSNASTDSTATGLSAGTYTVNVTDSLGTKGSAIITITQPSELGLNSFVTANVTCNGDSNGIATNMVSGGTVPYTYIWNDADSQTTVTATGLIAGTYTLTATDSNGCSVSTMVSISQPAAIIANIIEYAGIKCNGDSNAVIFADATGGSGFYAYSWNDASSQITALDTGLSAGNYTVTVTDNNGCTGTASATITQPSVLSIAAESINATGGNCNGSAWVTVSGGTPLYTYFWTGGLTTDTITNQCEGNYCSTVTDANGCIDSTCITINVSTGINELRVNSEELRVYPNPNSGIFTIVLSHAELVSSAAAEQPIVELYNVLGEKIYFATLKQVQGDNLIDLTEQPDGIYFYKVIKEDGGLIGEGKIVIEK